MIVAYTCSMTDYIPTSQNYIPEGMIDLGVGDPDFSLLPLDMLRRAGFYGVHGGRVSPLAREASRTHTSVTGTRGSESPIQALTRSGSNPDAR